MSNFIIAFDSAGHLVESSGDFEPEGLFRICFKEFELTGVDPSSKDLKASFKSRSIMYTKPYIHMIGNQLDSIFSPACMSEELFYMYIGDLLYLSNSLRSLAVEEGSLSIDDTQDFHFIKKNTTQPGKTFFKNISRIVPFSSYEFANGKLSEVERKVGEGSIHFKSDREAYSFFKKALVLSVRHYCRDRDEVALLFSGGVDSTLLGVIAEKELGLRVRAFTMECHPTNEVFAHDLSRVEHVIETVKWGKQTTQTDYRDVDWSKIDYYVDSVPLAPHLPFAYDDMYRKIHESGFDSVLTGQNLDTLYNLGATSRLSLSFSSLVAFLRRFYFSELFFYSLRSSRCNPIGCLVRLVSKLGFLFFKKYKKADYIYPSTVEEACHFYAASQDEFPFLLNDQSYLKEKMKDSCFDDNLGYQYLLSVKIKEYLMSGPNAFNHACAKRYSVNAGLVFGSEILNKFFISNRIYFRDIFNPKRFVHEYLRELDPEVFKRITKYKSRDIGQEMKIHDWFKLLCTDSAFSEKFNKNDEEIMKYINSKNTSAQRFNMNQSFLWRSYFMSNCYKERER